MEILKRLRKISLKKVMLPAVIVFAAAIAVFFIFDGVSTIKSLFPKSFAELDINDMDGVYVKDEIYFLYGQYAEEEEYRNNRRTGKITGAQYLTDLDEIYYIGLFGHEKHLDTLEGMMDACRNYANGLIYADDVPVLSVKGTMRAMDSQISRYYWSMADGDEGTISVMLPYYLDMDHIGDRSLLTAWAMLALAVGLLALSVFVILSALTGKYQKKMLKTVDAMGDREAVLERLEQFYDTTEPVSGVRMGREFVYFQNGAGSVLMRPWDLVWAYQSTTQHRTNGIPTGKTYAAILRTMDGKQYSLSMKEAEVKTLLEAIHQTLPGVVLGYDKELEQMYNKNRKAFAARWEETWPGCTGTVSAESDTAAPV